MVEPRLEPYVVKTTDPIRVAMLKISENKHRAVIVLDGERVVGTVSDGDLRRAFLDDVLPGAPVTEIMNINCVSTTDRDPERGYALLVEKHVTVLPVVTEEQTLVDVVLAYEPFGDRPPARASS